MADTHVTRRQAPAELLPCPFCGGEHVRKELLPHNSRPVLEELNEDAGGGWRVCCYGCQVQTFNGLTREQAIETWNRRAQGAGTSNG